MSYMFNSWALGIIDNENMLLMESLIHQSYVSGCLTEEETKKLKAMCEEKLKKIEAAKSASSEN